MFIEQKKRGPKKTAEGGGGQEAPVKKARVQSSVSQDFCHSNPEVGSIGFKEEDQSISLTSEDDLANLLNGGTGEDDLANLLNGGTGVTLHDVGISF
jgi:hypothetical protein